MAKKKKLTPEELEAENAKMRAEIEANKQANSEDSKRIVNALSMQNILIYCVVILLPIVGVPLIWLKKDKMGINFASRIAWTFVGIIIFVQQIRLLLSL